MKKTITKINALPQLEKKINVAAYARVSSGKDTMLHSLSSQVSYYNKLIQENNNWNFIGIYADEALSGTKENRANFQRMINDCREGKIDMIITKSISRFARNTVTMLSMVRELKDLNVDVFFEEQNIHSISSDGELILTFLASFAQEESRSASENIKWRIKRKFEEGIPWGAKLYGYKVKDSKFYIDEEEAKIVKLVYELYLKGFGKERIARELNSRGLRTRCGAEWSDTSVKHMLTNYTYTGNLLLQKTYRPDFIVKKAVKNNGEKPQYHVEESHSPIIDINMFNQVQEENKRRNNKINKREYIYQSPYKNFMMCGNCGKHLKRKDLKYRAFWLCNTYIKKGMNVCPAKRLDEEEFLNIMNEIKSTLMVEDDMLLSMLKEIRVFNDFTLEVELQNGQIFIKEWKTHSRKDSWTPEMRMQARIKELERLANYGESNSNSINN